MLLEVLFKGRSIKTWPQRDSKATRGNLMQITQYQQKTPKLCLGIFTATPSSSQAKQLKALNHQLPFPSTFGRSLWLLASQLAPMMTLFILQATLRLQPQLFYHNFVWQSVCVFLRSAWSSSRGDMNRTGSWGQCIRPDENTLENWSTVTIATR